MIQKKLFSLVAVCALSSSAMASDLGTLQVESSTIDVKTDVTTEASHVDIISEETIQTVGPKNLVDVLKTVAGVTSVARAGEMMQIRFRGVGQQQYMGSNLVLLLLLMVFLLCQMQVELESI